MLTERWSVFLYWNPLFMKMSAYFWLTKNTLYFRRPLVLPLAYTNALSASISSLPCNCYGLDYTPLKLVAKTTASHSGWMQNPSKLHYGAECSNSQRSSVPVGGWLQRKLEQDLNHTVQRGTHRDYLGNSYSKLKDYSINLVGLHVCDKEMLWEIPQEQRSKKPRRHSEQILGGNEANE